MGVFRDPPRGASPRSVPGLGAGRGQVASEEDWSGTCGDGADVGPGGSDAGRRSHQGCTVEGGHRLLE